MNDDQVATLRAKLLENLERRRIADIRLAEEAKKWVARGYKQCKDCKEDMPWNNLAPINSLASGFQSGVCNWCVSARSKKNYLMKTYSSDVHICQSRN